MKNYLFTFPFFLAVVLLISCQTAPSTQKSSADTPETLLSSIDFDVDMGHQPWAFDIEAATLANESYRSANWTGQFMQLVFMTLKPGEEIDLEIHDGHDQFIRIEEGKALVLMGKEAGNLTWRQEVEDDWAILIPAGYWHQIKNTGTNDLKLYTLYGPPEHPKGTVNKSYEEAKAAHTHEH